MVVFLVVVKFGNFVILYFFEMMFMFCVGKYYEYWVVEIFFGDEFIFFFM